MIKNQDIKILYFTATGNSLHIAKSFPGELLSIPQMIKENRYEFEGEKIGIIFPLHSWTAPTYVIDFLKKANFNSDYLFGITTYGIYSGGVSGHLQRVASEAGYKFNYINKIRMVDSYLPTFDMEKELKKEPKKQIAKHLEVIKSDIENSKEYLLKESFLSKMATSYMLKRGDKPFNKKRMKIHAMGEGIERYIYVDDTCTECGICVRVCPVDNISIDNEHGKIALKDKCFMCLACIHHCPPRAIHIRGEVNSNRYRNKNIELAEIIRANNQGE